MSFFDRLFGRTEKTAAAAQPEPMQVQVMNNSSEKSDERQDATPKKDERQDQPQHQGPYIGVPVDLHKVGYPIDVIYSFINRDYHRIGFEDALVNGSKEYSNTRQSIIRNELKTLFLQVTHTYNERIGNIEQKVDEAESNMLMTVANRLRRTLTTYNEHVDTIRQMEEWLDADDPRMTQMLASYRMGFTKGFIVSCGGELNMGAAEKKNAVSAQEELPLSINSKTA